MYSNRSSEKMLLRDIKCNVIEKNYYMHCNIIYNINCNYDINKNKIEYNNAYN